MGNTNSTTINYDRERGKHLKFEDRCSIKVCNKLGLSLRKTAEVVNCSASTVMYELKRGTGKRKGLKGRNPEYSAKRGQATYEANRAGCHKAKKVSVENPFILWIIDSVRNKQWSLDSCVGYAKKNAFFASEDMVCTKTLYNAVWNGIILSPFELPEALSRSERKRKHNKNKRIYGTSIEERPEDYASGKEYGHWEIDTVIGRKTGRESVVLTLVEKASDFYIAVKIPSKTSEAVMAALDVLREEYGNAHFNTVFKSITADNGVEFEQLAKLEEYGVKVYFAHPYSSWERPQNERHNRIFRKYVPKGVSIEKYTAEQILCFADDMNALPRKRLNYSTPEELFDSFLDEVYSLERSPGNLPSATVQVEFAI